MWVLLNAAAWSPTSLERCESEEAMTELYVLDELTAANYLLSAFNYVITKI